MELPAQLRVSLPGCMFIKMPVKTSPTQARRIAGFHDGWGKREKGDSLNCVNLMNDAGVV